MKHLRFALVNKRQGFPSFLGEIPRGTGSCLSYSHESDKHQLVWKKQKIEGEI